MLWPAPLAGDHLGGGLRGLLELRDLRFRQRAVQRIGGRHGADQDQHDQAHALLAVVGAVREADAGAGEDQDAADPQRRRLVALRARRYSAGLRDDELQHQQQDRGQHEAEQRRQQQRVADLGRLASSRRRRCRRGRASARWRCRRR